MHAIPYRSPIQLASRLCAKRDHSDPRGTTKQEFRRRKQDRRDFRQEIALCIWGAAALSHSVEL